MMGKLEGLKLKLEIDLQELLGEEFEAGVTNTNTCEGDVTCKDRHPLDMFEELMENPPVMKEDVIEQDKIWEEGFKCGKDYAGGLDTNQAIKDELEEIIMACANKPAEAWRIEVLKRANNRSSGVWCCDHLLQPDILRPAIKKYR